MPRSIWKGAISFGLVHVPVGLYSGSSSGGVDFDWLDDRSLDPVGYKRINKRTGREIDKDHIVKGVKVEGGDYVVLSDEEIRAAYPKTTQTIAIESFVHAAEIPFVFLEAPYYLEPADRGDRVYALLREAMLDAGVVGVARVVMHTKEHLAVLAPSGPGLVLNTLRWASEIRPWTELRLPPEGQKANDLKPAEMKMAAQLIESMTERWQADRYADKFTDAVHQLIEQRVAAGETAQVEPLEEAPPEASNNVVDLTELLARSLGRAPSAGGKGAARPAGAKRAADGSADARPAAGKATGSKTDGAKATPARKAPAAKRSGKSAAAKKAATRAADAAPARKRA